MRTDRVNSSITPGTELSYTEQVLGLRGNLTAWVKQEGQQQVSWASCYTQQGLGKLITLPSPLWGNRGRTYSLQSTSVHSSLSPLGTLDSRSPREYPAYCQGKWMFCTFRVLWEQHECQNDWGPFWNTRWKSANQGNDIGVWPYQSHPFLSKECPRQNVSRKAFGSGKNMKEYTQASWKDIQVKWEEPTPIDCFLKSFRSGLWCCLLLPISHHSLTDTPSSVTAPWTPEPLPPYLLLRLELSVFVKPSLTSAPGKRKSPPCRCLYAPAHTHVHICCMPTPEIFTHRTEFRSWLNFTLDHRESSCLMHEFSVRSE